nr:hypothetical protein [Pseudonocardiales bacterium]
MADGPFGRQVRAGPVGASSLAGEPDRQQQPVSVTGPQVDVEHLVHPLDPRPGKVWNEAGRLAESKLDEPGRHLCGVDRLKPEAGRDRYHRQLRQLSDHCQHRVVELGAGGQVLSVMGFTVTHSKIVAIDVLYDPDRLADLDLAVLD